MSERFSASDQNNRRGDRVAGAVVVGLALLLWFVVIPDQVDRVDYGWMRPRTLPGICSAAMGLFGLCLLAFPGARSEGVALGQVLRLAALVGLVIVALWGISHLGFIYVAPLLAAVLVTLLGERRWLWIVVAVVGAPAVIWLVVAVLLQRPLP